MDLTKKEYENIRNALTASEKPFFLFHDDPDGLTSYLLLKRFIGKGNGMMVKARPNIDNRFIDFVKKASPDTVFVVDVAMMQKDFVDAVKQSGVKKIVWIDHHQPMKLSGVDYFNPRTHSIHNNPPASYLCYEAVKETRKEDLWLAMTGIISDWYMPKFENQFRKQYPDLLPKKMTAEQAIFTTKIGRLGRMLSFMLKGSLINALACIRALENVKTPYEILEKSTNEGILIHEKFDRIYENYEIILNDAKATADDTSKDKFLIFTYKTNQSFTGDLSNELLFLYPKRIIVIGREKSDRVMLSFRSRDVPVLPALQKALKGIDGYGGGHENACGGSVSKEDFPKFIEQLKNEF
jgi:single-stranded DNA-specific DHH superfamily exonuclease